MYYKPEEVFQFMSEAGIKDAKLLATEHHHFRKGKIGSAVYVILAIRNES